MPEELSEKSVDADGPETLTFKYQYLDILAAALVILTVAFPVLVSTWAGVIFGFQDFWSDLQKFSNFSGLSGWVWIFLVGLSIWNFFRHLPVRIEEDSIAILLFTYRYKVIFWREVRKVVHRTSFEGERAKAAETIIIVGNAAKLSIRSEISDFERIRILVEGSAQKQNLSIEEMVER